MTAPIWFWPLVAFATGITIGSFLNAVIYRLPNGLSLLEPQKSICPNCKHSLGWLDLVPLFSFLLLGQKCRYCKKPIAWRYFWVELLTGMLFAALALRFANDAPTCIALLLFTACLISIYFIDLATFIIPLSLNLLVFAIALARDGWGIVQHQVGHELLGGWLPRSLAGAVLGILLFGAVRVAGWLWKRQEAMGLGDVLLARGMGAMLISVTPVGWYWWALFPIWVMLSCLSGIVVGPALILARMNRVRVQHQRKQRSLVRLAQIWSRKRGLLARLRYEALPSAEAEEILSENGSSLLRELAEIGWVLIVADLPEWIRSYRHGSIPVEEEPFEPAPSAIPFGPFLVIGFLATVFAGAWLTAAYLAYALPKQKP